MGRKNKIKNTLDYDLSETIVNPDAEDENYYTNRLLIGVPTTGNIRMEWAVGKYGQITPTNWSSVDSVQKIDQYSPLGFSVADARNLVVQKCIEGNFEWLFFIDHDTIMPNGTYLRFNHRMQEKKIPVWCGLYFCKGVPADPLIYRGRGNSYYRDWKFGDEVWCDGIPMGCTMIHSSVLKIMYDESEDYEVASNIRARRVFETPARIWFDPEKMAWVSARGTEDLEWCNRVIKEKVLKRAGWPEIAKKKYPFLVDTAVFCRHIAPNGIQYPAYGEEVQFMAKKDRESYERRRKRLEKRKKNKK